MKSCKIISRRGPTNNVTILLIYSKLFKFSYKILNKVLSLIIFLNYALKILEEWWNTW